MCQMHMTAEFVAFDSEMTRLTNVNVIHSSVSRRISANGLLYNFVGSFLTLFWKDYFS